MALASIPRSFTPSPAFIALTNHKPIVIGQYEGIWRRLRLVPWDVVIPPRHDLLTYTASMTNREAAYPTACIT
jgi:phage/plasmid-associated DNA primase